MGKMKWVKAVKYTLMEGNYNLDSEHVIEYADVIV